MKLIGKNIVLVPAKETDRRKIFAWLAQSDLTSSMFGEPNYPDHPIPSWEEFCKDYTLDFFSRSGDGKGRCYIVFHNDKVYNNNNGGNSPWHSKFIL
jgi:diamine N-acetyltransferase